MKIFDRGSYKEAKYCNYCNRIFTIRKKWKNSFEEVKFCSKKCRDLSKKS